MKLKKGLWIVVADGGRGIVLVNEGTAFDPQLKAVRSYGQDNPKTSEQGRDKPARAFESTGSRRSAMEAPDLHQRAEDEFVAGIMADLSKDAEADAFEHVVIIAAPVALGEMRKAVTAQLEPRIALWLGKDLTKEPSQKIADAVMKALES